MGCKKSILHNLYILNNVHYLNKEVILHVIIIILGLVVCNGVNPIDILCEVDARFDTHPTLVLEL
jgi:hypothetical protein